MLIALICFWDADSGRRQLSIGSLISYAVTQVITVVYFFPQNRLLREGSIDEVAKLFNQFAPMRTHLDQLRNVLTLASYVLLLIALGHPLP